MENNEQIFIMNHPLIQHKLSFLRDKNTGTKEFRELVSEIATLMCYEATRDLPLMDVQTETPMRNDEGHRRQKAGIRADSARRSRHGRRHAAARSERKGRPYRSLP